MDREVTGMMVIPDGFALNLEAVTLRLCAPFCSPPADHDIHPRLLTVDPSFCAVESGPFCRGGLHQQTCLLPPATDEDAKVLYSINLTSNNKYRYAYYPFNLCIMCITH
jgi:hypothetical protein